LRDEAHRFAIGSHRVRRTMEMRKNPLDEIDGVGPGRKKALLHAFGSAKGVSRASAADLAKVEGVSAQLAQRIYDFFHRTRIAASCYEARTLKAESGPCRTGRVTMKHIPNILTGIRLFGGVLMFLFLAAAAGGVPFISESLTPDTQFDLERWALVLFVIACLTDFFDGWVARKLNATSVWGTILDPIGDKILICGAILGLAALGPQPQAAIPFAVILFREFAVSALREGVAPKGIKIPVTMLAKWKTTLQMVAIFAELLVGSWAAWGLPSDPDVLGNATTVAHVLLWIAAAITFWTGAEYWHKAHKAIGDN
jgi:CDP-diacylglycerol--glycerol-3-phosphate 3-phosphatidyltransferase